METIIKRYVKNSSGNRIGLLTGRIGGQAPFRSVMIGWSLCRAGDKFDNDFAQDQAFRNEGCLLPPSLMTEACRFRLRCFLYFKDADVIHKVAPMAYKRQKAARKPPKAIRNNGHSIDCEGAYMAMNKRRSWELPESERKTSREQMSKTCTCRALKEKITREVNEFIDNIADRPDLDTAVVRRKYVLVRKQKSIQPELKPELQSELQSELQPESVVIA